MKFLYIGSSLKKLQHLQKVVNRSDIRLEQALTPEEAFFGLLNEVIAGVFIDLTDASIHGSELIHSLHSINPEIEMVLIGERNDIGALDDASLRRCYGVLSPPLDQPCNSMVLRQLTEKLSLHVRLEMLKTSSIIDGLTQLYNHAHFQQQLEKELETMAEDRAPVSLIIFDVDNFKIYNDTNGHPAGDKVLKKLARLVEGSVRKIDLTARYGGEEFVIVLPGTKLRTALTVAERCRRKIVSTVFEFGERQPLGFVSASFGVATVDYQTIENKASLIQMADKALYTAKRSHKNCVCYFKGGEFEHYQPQADK